MKNEQKLLSVEVDVIKNIWRQIFSFFFCQFRNGPNTERSPLFLCLLRVFMWMISSHKKPKVIFWKDYFWYYFSVLCWKKTLSIWYLSFLEHQKNLTLWSIFITILLKHSYGIRCRNIKRSYFTTAHISGSVWKMNLLSKHAQ